MLGPMPYLRPLQLKETIWRAAFALCPNLAGTLKHGLGFRVSGSGFREFRVYRV